MTLGSLADICFALGIEPRVRFNVAQAEEKACGVEASHTTWERSESEMPRKNVQALGKNVVDLGHI